MSNASTSGNGLRPFFDSSVAATVELMKGGPGRLYGLQWDNTGTKAFLQLFDAKAAADVTLGTTPPVKSVPLPATASGQLMWDTIGLSFLKGICYAVTGTSTGNGAPGAAAVLNADYA